MKKIIMLLGVCFLLPACTLDLSGEAGTDGSTSTGINLSTTNLDTSFGIGDDDGLIGTIGDGDFTFGDGKLF